MRGAGALVLALLLAACRGGVSKDTQEAIKDVLTLRTGTVSELHERYGAGPFRDYAVPPREMLDLVTAVLETFVPAVFQDERTLTAVAKERRGKDAWVDDYSPEWESAVIVFVHPVAGNPGACRVEIHATNRGAFDKGRIAWESVLPPRLDEAVAKRGRTPIRPLSR